MLSAMRLKLLERDTDAPHVGLICTTAFIYAGLKEAKRAVRGLWLHTTDEKHKTRSRCGDMRTGEAACGFKNTYADTNTRRCTYKRDTAEVEEKSDRKRRGHTCWAGVDERSLPSTSW